MTFHQQLLPGRPGVNGLGSEPDAFVKISGMARGDQGGGGVHQDHVPLRAALSAQDVVNNLDVLGDVAAEQVRQRAARQAQVFRAQGPRLRDGPRRRCG